MKRWEYSIGWKALAGILNQVCAVVLVLSVAVCTIYISSNGFGWPGEAGSFEDSEYYRSELEDEIYRCIRAASRESKFEENGVYNPKKPVNITRYVEDGTILQGASANEDVYYSDGDLYYSLDDLLNWSLDGFDTSILMKITYMDGSIGYIFQNPMSRTEQSVYEDGEAVSSMSVVSDEAAYTRETEEDADTVSDASAVFEIGGQSAVQNVEQIEAVTERYAPLGYTGIVDYAEQQQLTTEELRDVYRKLQTLLPMIHNDYTSYKENLEFFSPGMTNMRYMIIPKAVKEVTKENYTQQLTTNVRTLGDAEKLTVDELLALMRGFGGDYLIYDSSDMSFDSEGMPVTLSEISAYVKSYQPSVEGDFILAVAVDSRYMASDTLQEYKQQYEELRPVSRLAVYGSVLGAVLYLLTLVYLTLAAGRGTDGEDRSIHLNSFDRVKTEPACLIIVIPAAVVLVMGLMLYATMNDTAGGISFLTAGLLGGGVAFVLNLLFLIGYTSVIRRLKSRTLWSNSVLYAVMRLLGAVIRNRRVTTKTVITYIAFLMGNILLLMFGVAGFLGTLLLDFIVGIVLIQQALQRQRILDGMEKIAEGSLTYQIPTDGLNGDNELFARAVNSIGKGLSMAVEQSVKDERMKSDLITNVSHDIKTPLTSIINYVDLLKREDIRNERAKNYIAILEDKALRLKHLTDDLVEASKISSGNVTLEFTRINFQELIYQTTGEFSEKFEAKNLQLVLNMPKEPVVIEADGRRLWRVIENLYNNVAKYAMPHTRVYVDLTVVGHMVRFNIKNVSENALNIDAGELTERFIRGDVARSTEGSGLGLSIAKNLTQLQRGSFDIYLDGDLFKVTIIFPEAPAREEEQGGEERQEEGPAVEDISREECVETSEASPETEDKE